MRKFKIMFCDLDGTLIFKKNKESDSPWNFDINFKLLEKIKMMRPEYIFIVTNQSNVGKTVTEKEFEGKLDFVCACISYYIRNEFYAPKEVNGIYCQSDDLEEYYRKPNPGMLDVLCKTYKLLENFTKNDMIFIGDSSGKNSNSGIGDSDIKTAENFGIIYYDVNDFITIENFR